MVLSWFSSSSRSLFFFLRPCFKEFNLLKYSGCLSSSPQKVYSVHFFNLQGFEF